MFYDTYLKIQNLEFLTIRLNTPNLLHLGKKYLESTLLLVPTGVDGAEYEDDILLELSSDPDLDLGFGFGPRLKTDSE